MIRRLIPVILAVLCTVLLSACRDTPRVETEAAPLPECRYEVYTIPLDLEDPCGIVDFFYNQPLQMESRGQLGFYGYYHSNGKRNVIQYMIDTRGNLTEMREYTQMEEAMYTANAWSDCSVLQRHQRADGTWLLTLCDNLTLTYYLVSLDGSGVQMCEGTRLSVHGDGENDASVGALLRARMIVIDDAYTVLFNEYTGNEFYIFDDTLGAHGPFEAASMVTDGYRSSDGTLILTCEDFSTLSYDPSSDRVKPIRLYADTAITAKAERIYYRDGVVYFFCDDGVYIQRDRTETYLFDWASSYLNPKNITVYAFLEDDGFLIWYKDPLTGVTAPAVLQKADNQLPEALSSRQTIRLLSVFCEEAETAYIKASVNRFNMTSTEYVIAHTDYDALYPDNRDDVVGNVAKKRQLMKEDAQNGLPYDIMLLGSRESWGATIRSYTEKGALADLSDLASEISMVDSVSAALQGRQGITALPVSVEFFSFLAKDTVVPIQDGFTVERLYEITEDISEGETLLLDNSMLTVRQIAQYDYVDFDAGTCDFTSDGFVKLLEYSAMTGRTAGGGRLFGSDLGMFLMISSTMSVTGDPLTPFRDGSLKFLSVQFANLDHIAMVYYLSALVGEDIHVCGFPTEQGGAMKMQGKVQAVVPAHTAHIDGVYSYLRILFSDEFQTSDVFLKNGLPVTQSAWEQIVNPGYYYYQEMYVPQSNGELELQLRLVDVLEHANRDNQTEKEFHTKCLYVTQEECDRVKERLLYTTVRGTGDHVISDIIEEERAAFASGIRTAKEAAKNIQSRVSIYLAE